MQASSGPRQASTQTEIVGTGRQRATSAAQLALEAPHAMYATTQLDFILITDISWQH